MNGTSRNRRHPYSHERMYALRYFKGSKTEALILARPPTGKFTRSSCYDNKNSAYVPADDDVVLRYIPLPTTGAADDVTAGGAVGVPGANAGTETATAAIEVEESIAALLDAPRATVVDETMGGVLGTAVVGTPTALGSAVGLAVGLVLAGLEVGEAVTIVCDGAGVGDTELSAVGTSVGAQDGAIVVAGCAEALITVGCAVGL